ncbi:MAG: hypothetical protein IT368_01320, partial [Candidatus Hydrogenedentes bacterium]|nr:hypothetical protein [Candidatus Hydrogenedentota bacterium]
IRKIAYWIIGMRVIDIYWNLAPSFAWNHSTINVLSAVFTITACVGFGGLWTYLYLRELKRRPLLPVHDPIAEMLLPANEEAVSHA